MLWLFVMEEEEISTSSERRIVGRYKGNSYTHTHMHLLVQILPHCGDRASNHKTCACLKIFPGKTLRRSSWHSFLMRQSITAISGEECWKIAKAHTVIKSSMTRGNLLGRQPMLHQVEAIVPPSVDIAIALNQQKRMPEEIWILHRILRVSALTLQFLSESGIESKNHLAFKFSREGSLEGSQLKVCQRQLVEAPTLLSCNYVSTFLVSSLQCWL